jgi:hypothetical protein
MIDVAGFVSEDLPINMIVGIELKDILSLSALAIFSPAYWMIRVPRLIACAVKSPLPAIRGVPMRIDYTSQADVRAFFHYSTMGEY